MTPQSHPPYPYHATKKSSVLCVIPVHQTLYQIRFFNAVTAQLRMIDRHPCILDEGNLFLYGPHDFVILIHAINKIGCSFTSVLSYNAKIFPLAFVVDVIQLPLVKRNGDLFHNYISYLRAKLSDWGLLMMPYIRPSRATFRRCWAAKLRR